MFGCSAINTWMLCVYVCVCTCLSSKPNLRERENLEHPLRTLHDALPTLPIPSPCRYFLLTRTVYPFIPIVLTAQKVNHPQSQM